MATRWPNIRFIWSHGGGTLIGLMTDSSRGADVLNGFENVSQNHRFGPSCAMR
jgi:hypothetical protein